MDCRTWFDESHIPARACLPLWVWGLPTATSYVQAAQAARTFGPGFSKDAALWRVYVFILELLVPAFFMAHADLVKWHRLCSDTGRFG